MYVQSFKLGSYQIWGQDNMYEHDVTFDIKPNLTAN